MPKLGVGFIGCGRILDLNILGYLDRDDVEVAAFCDVSEDRLRQRAEEYGAYGPARTYLDPADMLSDAQIDIVEVLTPHHLHHRMVLDCIKAGKHVSVQKPPAATLEEMEDMITAAGEAGVKLKVFENFVFYPPYLRAKELFEAGEIGEPVSFRYKMASSLAPGGWDVPLESWAWRIVEEMCGGGPCLWDDGYHKWSVAIDLLGDVEKVFAWIGSKEVLPGVAVDAPGIVAWRYDREPDLFGVCDSSLCKDLFIESKYYAIDERMELTGEKGVLWVTKCTADMLKVPPVLLYKDGRLTAFDDMPQDWGDSFRASTHHFIDCVTGGGEPRLSGARGREVLRFALAMMRSARENREIYLAELER